MSLAYEILRYVDRALVDPASAGDPRLLNRLAKYAKEAFEGIVALHAPVSPMTWETNTILSGAVQQSSRTNFRFPRSCEIVGFFPTLLVFGTQDTVVPTLDDVAVSIDTDNQNYLTSAEGLSAPTGGTTAGAFVTLSAMSVQVPRLLGYKLRNPTPDIGFTYRWKQITSAATPAYKSAFISMAVYARYL